MNAHREVGSLGVDQEQLLDFFLSFARFEYALKAAGFFRPRSRRRTRSDGPEEYPDAEPNWPRFAKSIRGVFRSDANPELAAACQYLCNYPPYREVVADDRHLMWETRAPHDGQAEVDRVLLYVRWVRNNLFHGGKFSPAHGDQVSKFIGTHRFDLFHGGKFRLPHGGPSRNVALISCSLVVLRACLALSPDVKAKYDDAAL